MTNDKKHTTVGQMKVFAERQDARDDEQDAKIRINTQGVVTEGDGTNYTAAVEGITDLTAGVHFIMIPHVSCTAADEITLNVNGLGAKNLVRPHPYKADMVVGKGTPLGWLTKDIPVIVMYDGTYWRALDVPYIDSEAFHGTLSVEKGGTDAANTADAAKNLHVVSFDAQTLTDEQKVQARENIGAAAPGEGGASGTQDWNANEGEAGHILNRTHYDERKELLAETKLSATDGVANLSGRLNLIVGHGYTVRWNGVDYNCTAAAHIEDDSLLVYLGNLGGLVSSVEATGEPFVIWDDTINAGATIFTMDGSSEMTVSIRHNFVRKLDNKYLDLEWLPKKTGHVILEEETVVDGKLSAVSTDNFTVGKELSIYINDVPHESVLQYDDADGWYAKITAAVSSEIFGDVSFIFHDSAVYVFFTSLNGQRVKICMKEIEKIPEKYLPDNIGSSVQSDWNANEGEAGHILNRTHYKELVDLFPEKTITFEYGSYAEEWPKDPFKVDETYIVTWGDEKYECKGLLFEDVVNVDGNDVFVSVAFIGNTILFGSEDSGEPFGAVWQDGQLVIVPADNSTSKRVRIQKYVYKPLERGFMPCHIVTLPAMDDRPAVHEDATVSITDESGEIIQALMNNYPVYLDLKLVREGCVTRSLVIGFSTVWPENMIRKAISAGEASTIPFFMEAREAFNDSTWTIYVNVTD